jgi:ABC-type amino acid transport substrate-binding protein
MRRSLIVKILKSFLIVLCVPVFSYILNRYNDNVDAAIDKVIQTVSSIGKRKESEVKVEVIREKYLDDDLVTFVTEEDDNDDVTEDEKDDEAVQNTENKRYGTVDGILKRGELVVIAKSDDSNYLFQMKTKDGKYVGKDVDFAKQLAHSLGVKLKYKMTCKGYDDIVTAVGNGEGDIGIAKMSYTPERSRKVLFSVPYVNSRKTLLVNRIALEKAKGATLETMFSDKNAVIGVTEGTSYEGFVKKMFPNAAVVSKQDWENDIIKPLETGKFTATMRDEIRVKLLLKTQPGLLVKLMPIILDCEPDSLAVIVNFKSIGFLCWINKLIESEEALESVDDLLLRYGEYMK